MASLRDIRKRIRSVKNTKQITKAMKMVAAAKLRKAQDAIIAARPYAQTLDQIIGDLVARSGDEGLAHPLLTQRSARRVELVVLTSDRGLAGGFNSNVIRRTSRFLVENGHDLERIELATVGRKGHDFFKNRGTPIRKDFPGLYSKLSYRLAADIAEEFSANFLNGEVDAVYLVYNQFGSAISQTVTLEQVLPLQTLAPAAQGATAAAAPAAAARAGGLQVRAGPPVRARPAGAPGGGHQGVPRAAGERGERAWRAHERHGERHQQRHRHDQLPHPQLQPHPPGGDHQGADGDRVRRRGAEVIDPS